MPFVVIMGVIAMVVVAVPVVVMVLVMAMRRAPDRIGPTLGRERCIDRPHLAAG